MEKKEYLAFNTEIKTLNDSAGTFEGYASVFGNVDSHNDVVVKGSFLESIKNRLPTLLWQHDTKMPIGKYISAHEDSKGLFVQGKISLGVQKGREAFELLKDGAISGLSIGYYTKEEEIGENGIRFLKSMELMEVSIVTFPSNKLSEVINTRSKADNIREFEKFLRDAGQYSREQAKIIASKGFRDFQNGQREVDIDYDVVLKQINDLKKTY